MNTLTRIKRDLLRKDFKTSLVSFPCISRINLLVFSGFSGVEEGGSPDSGASGESAKLADLKVIILYSLLVEIPLD